MFAPAANQQTHAVQKSSKLMQQSSFISGRQAALGTSIAAQCSNRKLAHQQALRAQPLQAAAQPTVRAANCQLQQQQQHQSQLLQPCQPAGAQFSSHSSRQRRRRTAPLKAHLQEQLSAAAGLPSRSRSTREQQQRSVHCTAWGRGRSSSASSSMQPPDPWQQQPPPQPPSDWSNGSGLNGSRMSNGSSNGTPLGSIDGAMNGSYTASPANPLESYDPWDDARPRSGPVGGVPQYEQTDWGWDGADQDWDPAEGLAPEQLADIERDYLDQMERRRVADEPPRDKWITPLLDWQSIYGAFDPDQSRTEDAMADEALTNKEESREALSFVGRLVVIPLLTGALISRAIAEPVLSFSLQNNPNAFAMTERQKIEGATAVHLEETRVRMMVAIGQAPPLDDAGMLRHLHEYALEVQEEERKRNESNLMTLISDSISAMVFFAMFVRDSTGRTAVFSTLGRLFEGLSDIAKAVMIILVADTLLGYHSEEGWTGLLDLILGHYGFEVEEESILLFVGIIPIAIDVMFKYWIFIGLNRISPGAVVTIKQLDRH